MHQEKAVGNSVPRCWSKTWEKAVSSFQSFHQKLFPSQTLGEGSLKEELLLRVHTKILGQDSIEAVPETYALDKAVTAALFQ